MQGRAPLPRTLLAGQQPTAATHHTSSRKANFLPPEAETPSFWKISSSAFLRRYNTSRSPCHTSFWLPENRRRKRKMSTESSTLAFKFFVLCHSCEASEYTTAAHNQVPKIHTTPKTSHKRLPSGPEAPPPCQTLDAHPVCSHGKPECPPQRTVFGVLFIFFF